MSKKVSVSFFTSKNIEDDLMNLCATSADYIHVDVGDGKFIERKFNPVKELTELEDPQKYIEEYSELDCEYITIHCEIKKDILNLLNLIKSYGIKCGLAISPDTDLCFLEPFLDDIDTILIMSVVPGKGGQSFIYNTVERIKRVRKLIGKRNIVINVDGGINSETAKLVDSDIVVSGSFVLNSDDWEKNINAVR